MMHYHFNLKYLFPCSMRDIRDLKINNATRSTTRSTTRFWNKEISIIIQNEN